MSCSAVRATPRKVKPQSVVKLRIGDSITFTEEEFERLSAAYFAEIERKVL
jgi:hypothetical protein